MATEESAISRGQFTSGRRAAPRLLLFSSVRGRILGGFTGVCLIFATVAGFSVWQESVHRSDLRELDRHSSTATLLQESEAQVSVAALLLQRYVVSGDESYVAEVRTHSEAGIRSLLEAATRSNQSGLQAISVTGADLAAGAGRVTALGQSGRKDEAATELEEIVPVFRDFRLKLEDATAQELQDVSTLRASSKRAGDRAFWLLAGSGATGIALALAASLFIARSIIRPLSELEATAKAVSEGDMSARAPADGPRELARVGRALNHMTAAVHERTEELRQSNEELWARNQQLTHARSVAASDGLTGIYNHRRFHEKIRELTLGAVDTGTPVSLIMLDVDNFKQVNDQLGHQAGDRVLREIADSLCDVVNREDAYRYGGDEFAVLLPAYDQERAVVLAEVLLRAVGRATGSESVKVSVSLGVAAFPESAATADELIYHADMAMNMAKSAGKNQVAQWHNSVGSSEANASGPAVTSAHG